MNRDKWTLLLLRNEGDEVQQLTIPVRTLRLLAAGAGLGVVAALFVFVLAGVRGVDSATNIHLERQNQTLSSELERLQAQVGVLEEELNHLAERDSEVRLLAGLDAIDPEVRQVGVGGPGSPTLEEHPLFQLDEGLGKDAFAASYDLNALQRRAHLLRESLAEAADSLEAHRDLLQSTPSILPTDGRVTSGFAAAREHPIHHEARPHHGVDISAPRGTPIMAAAQGTVVFSGRRAGYGLVMELDHGYGYRTLYGHASELLANVGESVNRGDVIARVGSSGTATSPHLHYEIHVGNRPVNPTDYVLTGAIP